MTVTLAEWREREREIDADAVLDGGSPLIDLLPLDFLASLTPMQALALRHDPRAWLRPAQLPPADNDWLVWLQMQGRGAGKSTSAAGWVISQVLQGHPSRPSDILLVAPKLDDCWTLMWRTIKAYVPPWVRYVERIARNSVLYPDHGVEIFMHSAEIEYRGGNIRGAWLDEPVRYTRGQELWSTLRLALRVPGTTPPRAVITTTPPRELNWLIDLACEPTTRVTRGRMRDNPALDKRAVDAAYLAMGATVEARRELDGEVVLETDGAVCRLSDIDRARVDVAPRLQQIVIAVDPAQSAKRDADAVGIVAAGIADGQVYVLESCSERLEPFDWARRAIEMAERHHAGRYIVEPTGSGSYPRATLEAMLGMMHAQRLPITDSKARGSKADRAAPLSAACAGGRLRLVGRHEALERELTTWHPRANWSPGALDALVHGASYLTHGWKWL